MALDRLSFDTLLGPLKDVLNQNMILRVLNSLKWFERVPSSVKNKVAKCFEVELFQSGSVIILQGSKNSKFYVLNEGNALIHRDGVVVGEQSAGESSTALCSSVHMSVVMSVHIQHDCPHVCPHVCPYVCSHVCPHVCPHVCRHVCPHVCSVVGSELLSS